MNPSIAHLGPPGTYSEQAALYYAQWLEINSGLSTILHPYGSIAQSLQAVTTGQAQWAVVPVENSIEGSVTMTMDTLWQLDTLSIQLALVMPIAHALISAATSLEAIQTVYSHPQALAQCQGWLGQFLPHVELIPSNSTTEALNGLAKDLTSAAIASSRAAQLYQLPVLASNISDYVDNSTRFWVVSGSQTQDRDISVTTATHTSMAFSVHANLPGSLVKILQVFADLGINLSRIESRPTKRSLGEYLFFIDLEADIKGRQMQTALAHLTIHTEILKVFGSYHVIPIGSAT